MAKEQLFNDLLQQGFQDYAQAPDANKPAVLQKMFSQMETLGIIGSVQDAATELPKLAAKLATFVAEGTAEASKTQQQQEQSLLMSITQFDQNFVKDTLSGSFGIVGFANSVITFLQTAVSLMGGDPKMFDGAREALYELRDDLRGDMQAAKADAKIDIGQTIDRFKQQFGDAIDHAMNNAPAIFNTLNNNNVKTISGSTASYAGTQAPTVGSPNEVTMQEFTDVVSGSNLLPELKMGLITTAAMAAEAMGNDSTLNQTELNILKGHASFKALDTAQQTAINPKLEYALTH